VVFLLPSELRVSVDKDGGVHHLLESVRQKKMSFWPLSFILNDGHIYFVTGHITLALTRL